MLGSLAVESADVVFVVPIHSAYVGEFTRLYLSIGPVEGDDVFFRTYLASHGRGAV